MLKKALRYADGIVKKCRNQHRIPISSATDFGVVAADLLSAIQPIFYSTPEEAVFRALGVE